MKQWAIFGDAGTTWSGDRLAIEVPLPDPLGTLAVQRRRFAERLAALPEQSWHRPTRCSRWDVADVVSHVADTNRWRLAGLAQLEDPSVPFPLDLTRFDPAETPHKLVVAARGRSVAALLDDLISGTEAVLEGTGKAMAAREGRLSPHFLGSYGIATHTLHLLWDSLLHERDVFIPLGEPSEPTNEELAAVGVYSLLFCSGGTGPFDPPTTIVATLTDRITRRYQLALSGGVVIGTHPTDLAEHTLTGSTVTVIDALAGRGRLDSAAFSDPGVEQRYASFAAKL